VPLTYSEELPCTCSVHTLLAKYTLLYTLMYIRPAVLNLWAAAHWSAADLCLVGREQGWELRNIFDVSH